MRQWLVIAALALICAVQTHGQTSGPWLIEGGLTATHFQQQIKSEIGGLRGRRLVNEFQIGLMAAGTYRIVDVLSGGLFLRVDRGERFAGRFDGFDSAGKTQIEGEVGGAYSELWFGPMLRASWNHLALEVGYAAIGIRDDNARTDIASVTDDTTSAFTTHPTIAWLVSLGGDIPVADDLAVTLRLEYRARYYHLRGGEELADGVEHGTQSIAPLIGIAWTF